MSTFAMLDTRKPLCFLPYSCGTTTDPELVRFAESLQLPGLMNSSDPVIDATPLEIEATGPFIAWVRSTKWGAPLESDLQSMATDGEGRSLLTSWLEFPDFKELVAAAQSVTASWGPALQRSCDEWTSQGVDRVYIEGYEL